MGEDDDAKWTAAALRREMSEHATEASGTEEERESAKHAQLAAFTEDFLLHHVGPEELKLVRQRVEAAASRGEFEALVYSFPSSLCTDDGRAINNGDPDWPATLQGKAREMYDAWERHGRTMGYRLKAQIVSFPGGIPGDVGFFLGWAPLDR